MAILRERQVWRKASRPDYGRRTGARINRLTPEQEANVRAWLCALHDQLGSWRRVADGIGIGLKSVERVMIGSRRPTLGWALRIATLASASIDEVLAGRRPPEGACPMCGRSG